MCLKMIKKLMALFLGLISISNLVSCITPSNLTEPKDNSFKTSCKSTPILESKLNADRKWPSVMIAILARNKATTLPFFLGSLETLDYPKERISLWIRSDHNLDKTVDILEDWLEEERDEYHNVNKRYSYKTQKFPDETSRYDWSQMHYAHLIALREEALLTARDMWADYVWFLDCDAILSNNDTLRKLVEQKKAVIAPMLQSTGAYSNFWCGMTEKLYYKRTPEYLPIVERESTGCFEVPMVHTATLIDLRLSSTSALTFDPKKLAGYKGPVDDIISFATSARTANIPMHILNHQHFGYVMTPLDKNDAFQVEEEQMTNLHLEALVEGPPLYVSQHLEKYVRIRTGNTMNFDEVYLINLRRRPQRRLRMLKSFEELGLKVKLIDAVDGKALDTQTLDNLGVNMLPEYSDPFHKRPLTMGEIGCFLSHYNIWKDVLANQHRTVLVLEDDIRFEPFFRRKLELLVQEMQNAQVDWDLIYLGRKRQGESAVEDFVVGTTRIVHVDYSYWTLGYLLSLSGAQKLVGAEPLGKMVPVDEYLPIMFNKHPETKWASYYPIKNLKAFSAHPLLIYPTHYTGESSYISDTEDSATMPQEILEKQKNPASVGFKNADIKSIFNDEL